MTNREFYSAILSAEVSDELKAFATESIAKLDARNEKRSSKPSKTAVANEPLKNAILEYLAEHKGSVAAEIAAALEISTQKASALCRQLIEDGLAVSNETKIPKKGKVKAYSLMEIAG